MTTMRVWAKEYYTTPYIVEADDVDDARRKVKMGAPREEDYEKTMVYEGLLHDEWEVEDVTVEDKLDAAIPKHRSLSEMAQEAINAQDAVNFRALVAAMLRAIDDLCAQDKFSKDHPIVNGWMSKLLSLQTGDPHGVWKDGSLYRMANPDVEQKLEEAHEVHKPAERA